MDEGFEEGSFFCKVFAEIEEGNSYGVSYSLPTMIERLMRFSKKPSSIS